VHVVYGHVEPPLITIEQARAANSYWTPKPLVLTNTESGSIDWNVKDGLVEFQGQVYNKFVKLNKSVQIRFGGQEHFYLEPHSVYVQVHEEDTLLIQSSTQDVKHIQEKVAHILGATRRVDFKSNRKPATFFKRVKIKV
jgi:xanthine dehydrogenase molybdopterin-binding subunit B